MRKQSHTRLNYKITVIGGYKNIRIIRLDVEREALYVTTVAALSNLTIQFNDSVYFFWSHNEGECFRDNCAVFLV